MKLLSLIIIFLITSCSITKRTESDSVSEPTAQAKKESRPVSKEVKTLTTKNNSAIKKYCKKMDQHFAKYNWGKSSCDQFSWKHVRNSHWGNPIVWYEFGDSKTAANKTLIMCGVHGDEITPVKFCFDLLDDLKKDKTLFKDTFVLIAPLVAPDSFFREKPTRTNARGVDVNRNFPTKDWNDKALSMWKSRYKSDKRRFPGHKASSEQETVFQVNLIRLYKPQKIISVHAPLSMLDYDGPTLSHVQGKAAKNLLKEMSHKAGNYKVYDYPFFPGSLGNFAGNEKGIPTYTLELPNSDWNKTNKYYSMFKDSIFHALTHPM